MRSVLPHSWFPTTASQDAQSAAPVLDALLSGIGTAWSFCYAMLGYVRAQARLATMGGCFLDLFAGDFFGDTLPRYANEADDQYRVRLRANLLVPRATRESVVALIEQLTGVAPLMFEPRRGSDTGGYGVGWFGYGSATLPFQFLMTLDQNGGVLRRESEASYLDAEGALRIAPRHVPRPLYVGAVRSSILVEGRGFNLIKDSVGWSGHSLPLASGVAGWTVGVSGGVPALWPSQPMLDMTVSGAGTLIGPTVSVQLSAGPFSGSVWVWIPGGHALTSLELVFTAPRVQGAAQADLGIVNAWQRLVAGLTVDAVGAGSATLQIVGAAAAAMTPMIGTQCWQIEPGSSATSFIPSSGQIGVRDMDRLTGATDTANNPELFNAVTVDAAISTAVPAGCTAWTSLQHIL